MNEQVINKNLPTQFSFTLQQPTQEEKKEKKKKKKRKENLVSSKY
jgi:hypothetical protein